MVEFLEPVLFHSKSLKSVLLIFTKEKSATKFDQDTEEFYNPKKSED